MSQQLELAVSERPENSTKGTVKSNRAKGVIPAVLYGAGKPESLWVNRKALEGLLHKAHSANALVSLSIEGEKASRKQIALIKSLQRDVIYNTPIHADFFRVNIHQKVEVSVPVHLEGESSGVKNQGGILEHLLRELKVRCAVSDIPAGFTVNVASLEIGQSIHVSDLKVPAGVEVLNTANQVVTTVVAPRAEEAAPAAVDAVAAAQPEVIAKGKKEEEGAEAAAGKVPAGGKAAPAPAAKTETPKK